MFCDFGIKEMESVRGSGDTKVITNRDDMISGKGGAGTEGYVKVWERWMTGQKGRDKGWWKKKEQGI